MTRLEREIVATVFAVVLLLTTVSLVFAAVGIVYYGGLGFDRRGCGDRWSPCRTFRYAFSRACQLSDSNQQAYFVKNVNRGYSSGKCDKTGGSGTEPGGDELVREAQLVATAVLAVVGVVLGSIGGRIYRRRVKLTK